MPNRLELPDELKSLIEKREHDRREQEKKEAAEANTSTYEGPERRSGEDRRKDDSE